MIISKTGDPMKNANPMTALVLTCIATTVASSAGAQDWPQWRGPNRDARAADFNAPKTWPKELAQKWKVNVGQGDSTPALVGDRLYVFARQEGTEVTRCLDAATGKELWQDKYEAQGADGPAAREHPGPRSSPTVAQGKVVTLGVRGMLSCLDGATGKKLWRKDEFQGAWPQFFTASSPMIVDDLCVAQLGGQNGGAVVAYDLATGNEKWKWTGDGTAYASPVLLTVGGVKMIVAETDKNIVGLSVADGKSLWQVAFAPQGRMGYNAASPIVDGQTILYAGSGRGAKAMKIEKQGDNFVAQELWSNADKSVQFNTPVLKNGLLYGLTQANDLFCLNAQNGQAAWSAPLGGTSGGGRGRGTGFGSIVDAGSVLLALTPASQLIAFQPSDKAYTEIARIKVAETPAYAYPIVTRNRVYIKDQDSVTLWTID
jgi:outer membrane protein assembly factor BamB